MPHVHSSNIGTHKQRSMDYPLLFSFILTFTLYPYFYSLSLLLLSILTFALYSYFYSLPLPPAAAARCFDAQHITGFEPAAELCGERFLLAIGPYERIASAGAGRSTL